METPISTTAASRVPLHIVKIAVQYYVKDETKTPQMVQFDKTKPLTSCIMDICSYWALTNYEDWALQTDPLSTHSSLKYYITEKNRGEIGHGSFLTLVPSAAKTVTDIIDGINMGDASAKHVALRLLSAHAPDVTFAQEFINQQGVDLILNVISGGGWDKSPATAGFGELTAVTLEAFLELMEHGIVLWDRFDQPFITKIASYVNRSISDPSVVQSSLTILENLLLYSQKQALVDKEISPAHLINHLKTKNVDIQQNVLSLINATFLRASSDVDRENRARAILSAGTREILLSDVIPVGISVKPEIARQLHILQCNLMKTIRPSTLLTTEFDDKQIADLRKFTAVVVVDSHVAVSATKKSVENSDELQRLGFKNGKNPSEDLTTVTSGTLVLDCMHYFASNHLDRFRPWLLESFARETTECPFLTASVEVVRVLLELFHIEHSSSDEQTNYDRVVFSCDFPFQEAFAIAMETMNKTWKEMRATRQDFSKVIGVLTEQLNLSLRSVPLPETMDKWRAKIKNLTYNRVVEIRKEQKKAKEELESRAEPIVRLREQLTPGVVDLIAENRLRYMQKGTCFAYRESGGFRFGDKKYSWFCILQGNKRLLYGNCDSNIPPLIQNLRKEVLLSDVKGLLIGKECPHVKNKKSSSMAFSLVLEGEKKTLDFVAGNEVEFNMWTDGLHRLLNEPMTSPSAVQELEKLLTWEIKMQLLGTEGFAIPEKALEIPPLPADFDFRR